MQDKIMVEVWETSKELCLEFKMTKLVFTEK